MLFVTELRKHDANLKRLLYGFLTSQVGNTSVRLVLSVMIYELTGNNSTLAAGFLVYTLPRMIFSNPMGKFCEKFDPRALMMCLDVIGFFAFIILAIFYQSWGLALVFFIYALAETLTVAYNSMMTKLFTKLYQDSNTINDIVTMNMQIVYLSLAIGPFISGYLIKWFNIEIALIFNACTFLVSMGCLYKMPTLMENSNILKELKDAFNIRDGFGNIENIKIALKIPIIVQYTTLFLTRSIAYGILNSIMPVIVLDRFKKGSEGLGHYFTFMVSGAVLGTMLYGRYVKLRVAAEGKQQTIYIICMALIETMFMYLMFTSENFVMFLTAGFVSTIFMLLVESRFGFIYAYFSPPDAKARIRSFEIFVKAVGFSIGTLISIFSIKHLNHAILVNITMFLMLISLMAFFIRIDTKLKLVSLENS
jgi:MFS family permease